MEVEEEEVVVVRRPRGPDNGGPHEVHPALVHVEVDAVRQARLEGRPLGLDALGPPPQVGRLREWRRNVGYLGTGHFVGA